MKAVVLDPDNMFDVERPLTKEDVQRLIQVCLLLDYIITQIKFHIATIYFIEGYFLLSWLEITEL